MRHTCVTTTVTGGGMPSGTEKIPWCGEDVKEDSDEPWISFSVDSSYSGSGIVVLWKMEGLDFRDALSNTVVQCNRNTVIWVECSIQYTHHICTRISYPCATHAHITIITTWEPIKAIVRAFQYSR